MPRNVLIIGTGLSGLATAEALLRRGIPVTILAGNGASPSPGADAILRYGSTSIAIWLGCQGCLLRGAMAPTYGVTL